MTKLRTLKDIEFIPKTATESYIFNALRQEAIKWIKEDIKCIGEMEEKSENVNLFISADARIEWIKYFFNITEEDLK